MAKQLRISGHVQGVGFRQAMQAEAERFGVTGWVKNRRDGTVEALVQGTPDAVTAILAWARRGPRAARVTEVRIIEMEADFERFEQRPTE